VERAHDHLPEDECLPACPGWAEGAIELLSLQRRYGEMLDACRRAGAIENISVSASAPGVILPEYLQDEDVVRLNLVVGRDTREVLLDEWGIRCDLTFRGRRFSCAFPWQSVLAGVLRPPKRERPRFGVIEGGKKD
jgi:hypothetical protein